MNKCKPNRATLVFSALCRNAFEEFYLDQGHIT